MEEQTFDFEQHYPCRLYREPEPNELFCIFADHAEANDWCAAVALSKKHNDCPLVFNEVMESSQFGYELNSMCKFLFDRTHIWPKLAVERNTGQATIFVLKTLNYQNLFRMVDFTSMSSHEGGGYGWQTTGHITGGELQGTRRKMLDDLAMSIRQGTINLYDREQIRQLQSFVYVKGRGQAEANKKDDYVIATAGALQIAQLTPDPDIDDYDEEEAKKKREKWRFK